MQHCFACSAFILPTLTVLSSLRQCETTPEPLEKCDPVNSTGRTTECQMKGQFLQKDLCMVAETASERITFKPKCGQHHHFFMSF